MRLILSRKGFDSSSGGCASPIFPDRSMVALPIPDRHSTVRYRDLTWRGRNLGDLVETLTRGRQRRDYGAHLDPDLRREVRRRSGEWRPALGQLGAAQGHLRKQGVGAGDLFLFWGLFRAVDELVRWAGSPRHYVWGWLQVSEVAPVDAVVRTRAGEWSWAKEHPHWAFPPDPTNTLYVARPELSLPGRARLGIPGHGVFDFAEDRCRLTAAGATNPLEWALPMGFLPAGRPALSYHHSASRWSKDGDHARLLAVSRGQEFVLDLDSYPEVVEWIASLICPPGSSPSTALHAQ
jgi:hypothetical protein